MKSDAEKTAIVLAVARTLSVGDLIKKPWPCSPERLGCVKEQPQSGPEGPKP